MDFCLIFVPFGHYDEPEILPYAINSIRPIGADGEHSPATDPRFSYKGEDVIQTIEQVCLKVGYPKTIRVDNGAEFISPDLELHDTDIRHLRRF
jgi:hypothetical protein